MKIIDENGAAIENPDLTLGYLVDDTEPVEHPAVEGVEEVSHYETVTEYPGGGRDVRKVIDVPGVPAQAAWTEQVPVQRYIRYTAEELAAQEEARKKVEAREKLPERVDALETANNDIILMMALNTSPGCGSSPHNSIIAAFASFGNVQLLNQITHQPEEI